MSQRAENKEFDLLSSSNGTETTGNEITLTHIAYDRLRQDILSGILQPGHKLRIEALKLRYDIGPSPLREALSRLTADGLVVNLLRRGFWIPEVTLEDFCDITRTRQILECAALGSAIEQNDTAWKNHLNKAYDNLNQVEATIAPDDIEAISAWEMLHRNFHMALTGGLESKWLGNVQQRLIDQSDRYRRLFLPRTAISLEVDHSHSQIMEFVNKRDVAKARATLTAHLDDALKRAEKSGYF
ncbi:MAG: FCD domain-containing protein [Alphaproteobacteria bacterium]|nr:FCD domain-containing protein [Alphaproteobacteria bacterium]MBT4086169.1 FCD domain-containing protein [Alphaproteobacteria bacterium]MBT4543786.1 FCD domain-containing protein [Alphaproteobacteria bacterium]MBT7744031.1 FCD domain-containing protein [Alphaproteobacteria bacterium]